MKSGAWISKPMKATKVQQLKVMFISLAELLFKAAIELIEGLIAAVIIIVIVVMISICLVLSVEVFTSATFSGKAYGTNLGLLVGAVVIFLVKTTIIIRICKIDLDSGSNFIVIA